MRTDPYDHDCEYCEFVEENDKLKARIAELEVEVKDLAQEKAELEAEQVTP